MCEHTGRRPMIFVAKEKNLAVSGIFDMSSIDICSSCTDDVKFARTVYLRCITYQHLGPFMIDGAPD